MAVDTPARIAVIGAGPIGLEAALYARYLGYDVDLLEQHTVGAYVARWGHVRMFSTWRQLTSPLGRAAIASQFEDWQCPDPDSPPTGAAWLEQYLIPLSKTDLIVDSLREQTRVRAVSRSEWLKTDRQVNRRDWTLRLLLQADDNTEEAIDADVVLDATGVLGQPRDYGPGGAPALGAHAAEHEVWRIVPDILGKDKSRFAGRSSLVTGGGTSAATAIVDLLALSSEYPDTRVTWVRRRPVQSDRPFVLVDPADRRRGMLELSQRVQGLEASPPPQLTIVAGGWVERVDREDGVWRITTGGADRVTWSGDEFVAVVGYRPDQDLFRELQVTSTPDRETTAAFAARLDGADPAAGAEADAACRLDSGEPDYYVLGAKSFGRAPGYFYHEGLRQIRDLFTRLGDRRDLDLYATADKDWERSFGSPSA